MRYLSIKDGTSVSYESNATFVEDFDVIVAGVGTAGAVAAVAAAQNGLRVLGVERMTAPGGMGVVGGVWIYYYGILAGVATELNRRALEIGRENGYVDYDYQQMERNICVPSSLKCAAIEEALRDNNAVLWTESTVSGVFTDNRRIVGLEIIRDGECVNVSCKSVIDAADAQVCRLAGCDITIGRESDGKTMHFSRSVGIVTNGKLRTDCTFCGYADDKDQREYTKSILSSISSEPCLHTDYKKCLPVIFESSLIGKREVCSVNAKFTYNMDDFLDGKFSQKPVYYTFAHFDNSNPDIKNENPAVLDWRVLISGNSYGLSVGVDMDSLVSKEYDNLFLAGKHIGVGRDLVATVRMKADIEKSGEVAALMAEQFVRKQCVSYEILKPELEKRGLLVCLYPSGYGMINHMIAPCVFEQAHLPEDIDEFGRVLASCSPETAFMYARHNRKDKDLLSRLYANLDGEDGVLRDNSAICLGLLGDNKGLPVLREILEKPAYVLEGYDRDPYYYPWLTDTEHCSTLKAMCLIDRFTDGDSYDTVAKIAADGAKSITENLDIRYRERFRRQIMQLAQSYLEKM